MTEKYSILFFNEDDCRNMGTTEAYLVAINSEEVLLDTIITEEQLLILSEQEQKTTTSKEIVQSVINNIKFYRPENDSGWYHGSNHFKNIMYSTPTESTEYIANDFIDKMFVTIGMGHEGICLGQFEIPDINKNH